MARISAVHEQCVVKCPYPDDLAIYAPLGCGFQTGAGTILNILKPKPYHSIAILGLGSVGFAALMAAKHLQVKQIIAVDIVAQKLDLAKQFGATHTLDASNNASLSQEIKQMTNGQGVTFAVDSTGVPKVIQEMIECLSIGGTAASIGAPPVGTNIQLDVASFFYMNKSYISVIEGDSIPKEVRLFMLVHAIFDPYRCSIRTRQRHSAS